MTIEMITEVAPVHIPHHTYKRECRYTRGIHIPLTDFQELYAAMTEESKLFFEFHNVAKDIETGTYLNGYAGLAKLIADYYKQKNIEVRDLTNGRDFYVKIV